MSSHDAISRFTLERYVHGELTGDELRQVEEALQQSDALRARVDALRGAQRAFLADNPYASFRIAHEKRRAPKLTLKVWLSGLVAVAAAAVFVLVPFDDTSTTRTKGGNAGLSLALVSGDQPKSLSSGAHIKPGDRVQPGYYTTNNTHLALLGIDGAGVVTIYYPESGTMMAGVIAGRRVFPFSLTIDDTPGSETLVAFFADEALPLDRLREALKHNEDIPDVRTIRVVLEKDR